MPRVHWHRALNDMAVRAREGDRDGQANDAKEPPELSLNIFARPDGRSARSARSRLTDVINLDRTAAATSTVAATAEIATLRQKLAAAEPRIRENTDRGRKPIEGGAGRRMVDGKNFRLADDVRYIQRRAAKCPSEDFLSPLNHMDSMEPIMIRGGAYSVYGQEPGEVRPRSLEISERPD